MFVLNAHFCRELKFVAILRFKLRFLLRNTGVDSEFLRKKLAAGGSVHDIDIEGSPDRNPEIPQPEFTRAL